MATKRRRRRKKTILDDKEICRMLDELRAQEVNHENCAMRQQFYAQCKENFMDLKPYKYKRPPQNYVPETIEDNNTTTTT